MDLRLQAGNLDGCPLRPIAGLVCSGRTLGYTEDVIPVRAENASTQVKRYARTVRDCSTGCRAGVGELVGA